MRTDYQSDGSKVSSRQGDERVLDRLFTLVYNDLKYLAKSYLARETPAHTLQPTALVNEAYIKLADQKRVDWKDRSHLLAVSALAMRRVLVNHAVAGKRQKRGGPALKVSFHDDLLYGVDSVSEYAVHEALRDLGKLNARHAKLVELRVFGGLSVGEAAGVLQVSASTIEKDWRFCCAWLKSALRPSGDH